MRLPESPNRTIGRSSICPGVASHGCPTDLIALGGDDQWADWTENGVISAVVVLGEHVIVWQDDPLTDEGEREIADDLRSRAQYEVEDLEDDE